MTRIDYIRGDEAMDDVHHALGRPQTAAQIDKPSRNYFCGPPESSNSMRFSNSPWWHLSHHINGGQDGIWIVTDEGKRALLAHLLNQMRESI